jgi:hypothetical protein
MHAKLVRRLGVTDIIDVEVKKRTHQIARADTAHHDNRVSNSDLGWCVRREFSARTKRMLEKPDKLGWIVNRQPTSNVMPSGIDLAIRRCSPCALTDFRSPAKRKSRLGTSPYQDSALRRDPGDAQPVPSGAAVPSWLEQLTPKEKGIRWPGPPADFSVSGG